MTRFALLFIFSSLLATGCNETPSAAQGTSVAEPRYLLFWRTPEQAPDLVKAIGEQGDGRTRLLGFGVPCATFVQEKQVPDNIHRAFSAARRHGLAVMLHFDFHIAWQNRPELWNWFDPKQPGYNPDNRRNVEWFGWEGPPARARYLNHGEAQRMPPPVCFTSKAVRAEWTRLIRDVIAPPIKKELAALEREGKGYLFTGVLVGSEPTFDNYSHTDPETAKQVAADGAPTGQLGYRALLDRGYSKDHPPADIRRALGEAIQETAAFWCKAFVQAGLPARKLYPHIPIGVPLEVTSAPVESAFNAYSRPGWSTYPVGYLGKNFQAIYDALKKHGSPPWGGVEANVGMPGTLVDWETYLGWHYNHGATLVAINLGATGTDLPAQLEKSAFSPEALAAYHKFLTGERLGEKPISGEAAEMRLRSKMETLQAGFRKWQAEGRDQSPIAHLVEERMPALLQANELDEAEALLDEALKRLNENETRYLAFQIFTYNPNPKLASMGEGSNNPSAAFPVKAALDAYIEDIKTRIGATGDKQTRLAVVLGPLSFDHSDAEITKFIELGFEVAIEKNVAVGFHVDDSMFWARRKDLWSDPKNVEALDWNGTPCTGRRLDWGKEPSAAPPQMCFNSKAIQREVQKRSALIGKAIQEGEKRLRQFKRPELFAGVIVGWETMLGQDFKTGKYSGYRALLNRGFTGEHPPADLNIEREKVVQEFIDLWTKGVAEAGVSPQKIYSHTAFLSRRAFDLGDNKAITYMKRAKDAAYSQQNHFAPPSVAFGANHRPGFSTYPQPGLLDDIYEQLAIHKQVGWASSEGTNMQPESGPGQTGMGMETYLAKMFNHGATLVNIFSWGVGGDANKNMGFRVVTEGEEALRAYRKFLKGEPLIEAKTETSTFQERLPVKIHKIQNGLPAWVQKTGKQALVEPLMQKLDAALKAKNFEEAEKTADSILKLMGGKP